MTEATVTQPTQAELEAELGKALASKDYGAVAKLSAKLSRFQADIDKAAREAKEKELLKVTARIKGAIDQAVKRLVDAGELDKADGVWYSNDFGSTLVDCRVLKPATVAKARAGGGNGAGKKYDAKTTDLLAKYGSQAVPEELKPKILKDISAEGWTWQMVQDAAEKHTDRKNATYQVRIALLKADGVIK